MTKYICSQCTGRSGEEHTFRLGEEPNACPYNGCEKRHIKTIEAYLRQRLEDVKFDLEIKEEKASKFIKIKRLAKKEASGQGWNNEDLEEFLGYFDLDDD